jgi:hypothetical protein
MRWGASRTRATDLQPADARDSGRLLRLRAWDGEQARAERKHRHGDHSGPINPHGMASGVARAAIGHAVVPPSSEMKARRFSRSNCISLPLAGNWTPQVPLGQRLPSRMKVSIGPFPLISTVPCGSSRKRSWMCQGVAAEIWMRFGMPCDSMRLAMFTASPQMS